MRHARYFAVLVSTLEKHTLFLECIGKFLIAFGQACFGITCCVPLAIMSAGSEGFQALSGHFSAFHSTVLLVAYITVVRSLPKFTSTVNATSLYASLGSAIQIGHVRLSFGRVLPLAIVDALPIRHTFFYAIVVISNIQQIFVRKAWQSTSLCRAARAYVGVHHGRAFAGSAPRSSARNVEFGITYPLTLAVSALYPC